MPNPKTHSLWPWWSLLLTVIMVSLISVMIPAWHIQPFRPQTDAGLAWSYAFKKWSPWITLAVLLAAVWLTWRLWRVRAGLVRKLVLLILLVPAFAAAWFARQNHFEWMFAPISSIAYAQASEASFLNDHDVVMSIVLNGAAAAYPVRQMAYHHVVNDVVGGRPITATY